MLKLTNMALQMARPGGDPVTLLETWWNSLADEILASGEILAAAAKTIPPESDCGQRLTPLDCVRSDLFNCWVRLELGDAGNRAILWAEARRAGLRPSNAAAFGCKDSPTDVAYAYVAEQLGVTGKDPAETIRKSVVRFVHRMRGTNAFIFIPSSCHIRFVSGNSILRAFGVR